MAHYEYKGQHFELPDGLDNQVALNKIKKHLGEQVDVNDMKAPDWLKNIGGAGMAVADMVGGIPGAIAGMATGAAVSAVDRDPVGGVELAKEIMGKSTPSAALGMDMSKNAGYNTAMWPVEMLGKGMELAGKGYGEISKVLGASDKTAGNIAALGELGLMIGTAVPVGRANMKPKAKEPIKTDPVLENLGKLDQKPVEPVDAGARAIQDIADSQLTGWQEPLREPQTRGSGIDTVVSQLEQQRLAEAQRILEERQKQMEFEVAQRASLDRNAAERARQEQAPTGRDVWVEQQRMAAEQRRPGDNTPLDFTPTESPTGLADTPYQYKGGIDYTLPRDKAALPIEVADILRTGERNTDPFNRYSPNQAARRILEEGETPPIIKTNRRGQEGNVDVVALREEIKNLADKITKLRESGMFKNLPFTQQMDLELPLVRKQNEIYKVINDHNDKVRAERQAAELQPFKDLTKQLGDLAASEARSNFSVVKGGKRGQAGGVDFEMLPKAFRDLTTRWTESGGNLTYGNVSRMLDDHPVKLDAMQRETLVALYPEVAKKYQERIDKAWLNGDEAKAKRYGKYHDDALIAEAVTKHFDAYGKGFKVDGQDYNSTTGFYAGKVAAREAKDNAINAARRFGGKQSGKIDFNGIADESKKIGERIASIGTRAVALATPKERVIARAINDNSLIPKGDAPEAIIAKALKESDGPALFENTQSGLTQAAAKADSALMFGVARWLNYGEKVGGKYFRENVKPVEQKLSNLSPDELSTTMKVMIQEMNRREQYTPEQLKAAGMTDKQLAAYQALRTEFDNVFKITNEARALQGKPPITKQGAYFASMWNGNYHMPVYDNKGRIIWYVKTETAGEAKKAAKWIAANVPDVNPKSLKAQYRPQNMTNRPPKDVISIYEDMLEVFKDTPMAQEIKTLMEGVQEDAGFTSRQHQVHFENKANIRGFAGDRPWLSDKDNALMGATAQVQYLKDAYRWAPLQEAMHNVKQILSNPELIENQPNNVAMARAYTANTMGYTKNMFQGFENYVSRLSGVSPSSYAKAVGGLKTLTYLTQLGISTGYMIATPLQALILGPAQHMKLTNQGFKYNFLTTAATAMSDALGMLGVHQLDSTLGKDYRGRLSPLGQEALRYMEDNGIIDVSLFDEYAALGAHKGIDTYKSIVGSTIQFPEKMARSMTFMSFVHHLKESGLPKAEIFRKAEELTDNTLTKFSKTARPLIADKMGLVGELAYTYKSPVFNYYNNLIEFAQDFKRTGNPMPLIMAGLVMPGLLGGLMSIPMISELEDGITMVKEGVAKFFPKHYDKFKDISIKEAAMRNLPDYAMYGAVSEVTGAQMASRFSTKTLDINRPLEDAFPAFGQAGNLASGVGGVLTNPNETTVAQGLYQNTQPAVRGTLETTMDTFKAGEQGDKTLYYNPNTLKERDVSIDRAAKDELYRRLGLTSVLEARKKDARYLTNTETKRRTDVQKAMVTGAIDAIARGEPTEVAEYISQYANNGGDPKQLMTQLNREIENSKLTPEQRQVMRAKTMQQIDAVQRRMAMER